MLPVSTFHMPVNLNVKRGTFYSHKYIKVCLKF